MNLTSAYNPRTKEALATVTSTDASKAEELRTAIWSLVGPKEQVLEYLKHC